MWTEVRSLQEAEESLLCGARVLAGNIRGNHLHGALTPPTEALLSPPAAEPKLPPPQGSFHYPGLRRKTFDLAFSNSDSLDHERIELFPV